MFLWNCLEYLVNLIQHKQKALPSTTFVPISWGQCKPHPPAVRTQHPLVGLYPHSSCGILVKDHLLEYHLVIMTDNEQELTINTNCMANEHQPSKGVLWNLKLAWFIHLPKVPFTAALRSSVYIQIFTCSVETLHSNTGNDTKKSEIIENYYSHRY